MQETAALQTLDNEDIGDTTFSLEQLGVISTLSFEQLKTLTTFTPEQLHAIRWAYDRSVQKCQTLSSRS